MAEQDKRRTTTRRRGELKEVDDKKVSGQFWQLPSGQRSKRKAAAEAQVEESESSQPVTDNVAPSATAPPQGADAPAASNRAPRTEPEDEISLKPSAILKRERHDSSSALHPLPPPGSVPSLASLAQKEINKEPSGGAFTAPAGGAPPPPPPPPLGKADRTEEEGGGTVRKPKRPRGKDFPEPAPSVQVGKPWMNERDVLGPLMYHVGEPLGDLDDSIGKTLQIYCPARYISHRNPEVIQRNLWGSHPAGYTDDSDVVCMLVHSALVHAGDVGPTDIAGVIAYIKVMPGLTTYPSSWDSSGMKIMKSRKWTAPHSASLRVERVELLERDHLLRTTYTLPQRPDGVVTPRRAPPAPDSEGQSSEPEIALKGKQDRDEEEDDENAQDAMQSLMGGKKKERSQKKDRILGDTVVMYNFSNEVCKKYTLAAVMDKGLDQQQWTAFRLKQQALYFENNEARFELSRLPPSAESPYDRYRWARVISPAASDMASFPLPVDYVQVLEDKLDWNDIQWGPTGCDVRGKSYAIKKVFWRAHRTVTPPPPPAEAVAKASGRKQRSLDGKGAPKDAAPAASVEAKKEEASLDGEAGGSSTLVHLRRVPKKKKNA